MLTADQLLSELLDRARALTATETLPTEAAGGRVLAAAQVSAITVPPLDNSAMDGYAVRAAECHGGQPLLVSQRIAAGHMGEPLQIASAARIFTGAPIPPGADAVVMQEHCTVDGNTIHVQRPVKPGDNIRRAGEDIMAGAEILPPGTRIGAAHMGLAASVGLATLPVYRRLKVASFSTGDELAQPGTALQPGQIYNSNRYTLTGLVQALECEWIDMGAIPDTLSDTIATLHRAATLADVIITSGGVSVGEEDHVKAAVSQLGTIDLWKVAMKPGKPVAFGRIGEADFIGLPGNPVSAFATFSLFARPFLLKRMGATQLRPTIYRVRAASEWLKSGDRREFLRGRTRIADDGELEVQLYPNQSSGVLNSTVWANGFVDLEIGQTIRIGDMVRFIPFSEVLQ
ncbi:molybdopterin molybdenumtransferase MoeA [Sulfuriferula sp. AH1]|uniref:molybdopterin molybdotransferase MoeA n=1 Tax=Sulfuriferula sp. AH1 TaxID=1985873 RepID=UPI000B3B6596|nr:gephyrin-like molybdotransferase Glp [Sulfuriferula sp. AH1]ARU32107.1 molybdopterin molybdenumtransferase MoeA [Sulfuriferula sp. AH1]